MAYKLFSAIIALILLFTNPLVAVAQGNGDLPIYVVQPGENLTEIAYKFHITLAELIKANNIVDVNLISAGTELVIPGMEGVSGILTAEPTIFGDNYHSIIRKYDLSEQTFTLLNPVTSPSEIYAGSTLILPKTVGQKSTKQAGYVSSQDSLLTMAVKTNQNFWTLYDENNISTSTFLPNEVLYYFSESENESGSLFSNLISKIEVNPLPVVQGHTSVVRIYAKEPVILAGNLGDKKLNFFQDQASGFYYALSGIYAIANPGLIPLRLTGTFNNGESFAVEQNILLISGGYRKEELTVEQTTIEEDVINSENNQIQQILNPVSLEKLWSGKFRFPVDGSLTDDTIGFSSYFGNRRSYNNGSFNGFHGGLDFRVVLMSFNIYAPAPGRVVYAGPMTIRGNTTFIDHGQGVYSGYAHQSEIKVSVGDMVQAGQIIGSIGSTGRVTGPHLHWDIWVNGNQVDPFDWVDNVYP
jgi:murein DD-endopeptidase MepM/ murein hydrolase activator NlpD